MSRSPAFVVFSMLAGVQACSSLGPDTLSQGRPAYNEAIAATNAEQSLSWIVRSRYGLPTAQLAVASITAGVRFSSAAGVNVGIGPSQSYAGNLVPLSGGVTYDENPTISYVPLQGMEHLRTLLSPVPMDLVGLLLNMNFQPHVVMAIVVKRINGIPNPGFYVDSSREADQRFAQVLAIAGRLSTADKLTFFQSSGDAQSYSVWIHDYLPDYGQDVGELLGVLGIEGIAIDGSDIVLPVAAALRRATRQSIVIQTRSVLDIGRIASASVDVPQADRARGLTLEFPTSGLAGDYIRVRRAAERPPTAAAATRFQNWWYYIAGDDASSKQYFLLFEALMSVQLSEAAAAANAPVLTVPVN